MAERRKVHNPQYGFRLKEFRGYLGIYAADLVRAVESRGLSVTKGYISLIESGERDLSLEVILALVLDYKINIFWLFTGLGPYQAKPAELARTVAQADPVEQLKESTRMINALNRQVTLLRLKIKEEAAASTPEPKDLAHEE